MKKRWDPWATPPKDTNGFLQWLQEDLVLFQQEQPDLPQGLPSSLSARDRRRVLQAWNKAREAAELEDAGRVSPEWREVVRKFHRTRTTTASKAKAGASMHRTRRCRGEGSSRPQGQGAASDQCWTLRLVFTQPSGAGQRSPLNSTSPRRDAVRSTIIELFLCPKTPRRDHDQEERPRVPQKRRNDLCIRCSGVYAASQGHAPEHHGARG